MRSTISSKLRLAVTLRYLASGNSYKSLEFLSRISRITIGNFVPEVYNAIITVLKDKYLKVSCKLKLYCQNINRKLILHFKFLQGKTKSEMNWNSVYYSIKCSIHNISGFTSVRRFCYLRLILILFKISISSDV